MAANLSEASDTPNASGDETHHTDSSHLPAMTATTSALREVDDTNDSESDTDNTHVRIQRELAKITSSLEGAGEVELVETMADRKFTIFSKLPIELRLIVWEMTLPGPRLISVYFLGPRDPTEGTDDENEIEEADDCRNTVRWKLTFSEKSPATLYTCQESRALALKHYQPRRTTDYDLSPQIWYIAPLKDTLFMMGHVITEDQNPLKVIASTIPNLAQLAVFEDEILPERRLDTRHLPTFAQLRDFIIMPLNSWPNWYQNKSLAMDAFKLESINCPLLSVEGGPEQYERAKAFQNAFAEVEKEHIGWKAPNLRIARWNL